MIKSIVRIK